MPEINQIFSMSDDLIRQNTGKVLSEWFTVLDKCSALEKGQIRAVNYLKDCYTLSDWWASALFERYKHEKSR